MRAGNLLTAHAPDAFIYGSERSGTTLLCALMSEHDSAYALNDTFIFETMNRLMESNLRSVASRARVRLWPSATAVALSRDSALIDPMAVPTQAIREQFLQRLKDRFAPRNASWSSEYSQWLDRLPVEGLTHEDDVTLRDFFAQVLPYFVDPDRHSPYLVEKTPRHLYLFPWLHRAYPHAPWVHLVRHPVTNVASIYRRGHSRSLRHAVALYQSFFPPAGPELDGQPGGLLIRYEDLLMNPAPTLQSIATHFALPEQDMTASFDYGLKSHSLGGAIDPDRDARAADHLTPDQQQTVRQQCSAIIERYYPDRA